MSIKLPVVFIHRGNSPYLINTIYQLAASNPGHEMYLIGTKESRVYNGMVTHIDISSYEKEAIDFKQYYRHFSINSEAFELICLQRWFILKEFLIRNAIDRCLYLDSDVLFYNDISSLAKQYEPFGMTICGISGHTNFVYTGVLESFCVFLLNKYKEPDAVRELEHYYHTVLVQKNASACISDMTFLTDFALKYPAVVTNIYAPEGKATFDPAFNVGAEYYIMDGLFKQIVFDKGMPYGMHKATREAVLFHTLHFQGSDAKKSMSAYITEKTLAFRVLKLWYTLIYILQKIHKKLSGN